MIKKSKLTPQEQAELAERVARNAQAYGDLKGRAEAVLGYELKTVSRARGFPYMTLDVVPLTDIDNELVFNVEVKWRGLTADQTRRLYALLTEGLR